MTEPGFKGMHFWVADMAATMTFYRLAGLPVPDGAETQQFVRIPLANGQSFEFGTYGLTRQYDRDFEPPPAGKGGACLQFDLPSRESVDNLHTKLTGAGYRNHLAPINAFWGARYMEVCDPDDNVVGFHSPRDSGLAGPPPPSR